MLKTHLTQISSRFVLVCTFAILATSAWATNSPQIIYSFGGGADGEYADTDLVMDSGGSLYGTTVQGGSFASGTIWQLSPAGSNWTHTVLYSFSGGTDGGGTLQRSHT